MESVKGAAESAKIVIAKVNENMPRTLGEAFIHMYASYRDELTAEWNQRFQ